MNTFSDKELVHIMALVSCRIVELMNILEEESAQLRELEGRQTIQHKTLATQHKHYTNEHKELLALCKHVGDLLKAK